MNYEANRVDVRKPSAGKISDGICCVNSQTIGGGD